MDRFSKIAKYYDRWHMIDTQYHPMHRFTVEVMWGHLRRYDDQRLLVAEIGFGTGVTTEALLKMDSRIHVVGADPSEGMMTLAVDRLRRAGLFARATLIRGEFQEVVRAVGSCQLVGSVCTFHNVEPEKRLAVCRHAFNLLDAGAVYVSGDKLALDDTGAYQRLFDGQIRAMAGYPTQFERDFWRLHELEDHLTRITESEMVAMLVDAGFEDVQILQRFGIYAVVTARKPQ